MSRFQLLGVMLSLGSIACLPEARVAAPRYFTPSAVETEAPETRSEVGPLLRLRRVQAAVHIKERIVWRRSNVEFGFREFRPFLGNCRFRDCRHEQEPGCAVLEAVQSGKISEGRMDSYRHIVASLDEG